MPQYGAKASALLGFDRIHPCGAQPAGGCLPLRALRAPLTRSEVRSRWQATSSGKAPSNLEKELAARDRKQKTRPWVMASVAVIGILGGGIYFATQDGGEDLAAEETTAAETTAEKQLRADRTKRAVALPPTVSCAYNEDGDNSNFVGLPPQATYPPGNVTIDLETTAGPIGMELDRSVSRTVNVVEHRSEGYNDTVATDDQLWG